jgi:hypothetical protein
MENVDLSDIESPFPLEKSIMSQICFESNVHNEEDQENVFVNFIFFKKIPRMLNT